MMVTERVNDGFDHIRECISEVNKGLCVFMADLILGMPIGLPYDDWRKLHMMKGDW